MWYQRKVETARFLKYFNVSNRIFLIEFSCFRKYLFHFIPCSLGKELGSIWDIWNVIKKWIVFLKMRNCWLSAFFLLSKCGFGWTTHRNYDLNSSFRIFVHLLLLVASICFQYQQSKTSSSPFQSEARFAFAWTLFITFELSFRILRSKNS